MAFTQTTSDAGDLKAITLKERSTASLGREPRRIPFICAFDSPFPPLPGFEELSSPQPGLRSHIHVPLEADSNESCSPEPIQEPLSCYSAFQMQLMRRFLEVTRTSESKEALAEAFGLTEELCNASCIALAIEYLSLEPSSMSAFSELLKEKREQLQKERSSLFHPSKQILILGELDPHDSEHLPSIFTLLELIYKCSIEGGEGCEVAWWELLEFASYFSSETIREDIFCTAGKIMSPLWSRSFFTEGKWNSASYKIMLKWFSTRALVQCGEKIEGSFSIRPYIALWLRLRKGLEHAHQVTLQSAAVLQVLVTDQDVFTRDAESRFCIQKHIEACHANLKAFVLVPGRSNEQLWSEYLLSFGIFLKESACHAQAEQLLLYSLDGFRSTLGPGHIRTLEAMYHTADLFISSDKEAHAELLIQEALRAEVLLHDEHYKLRLRMILLSGKLLEHQNRLSEAEEAYNQVRREVEERYGPDHLLTLEAVLLAAQICGRTKRFKARMQYSMQAREGLSSLLGSKHALTLRATVLLGHAYFKRKQLAEAESMYEEVVEGCTFTGLADLGLAEARYNLGIICTGQSRLPAAEVHLREACQIYERLEGPKSSDTLKAWRRLIIVCTLQKKHEAVDVMIRDVIERHLQKFGLEHPDTLRLLTRHASILDLQLQFSEAIPMYGDVVRGYERTLGPNHAKTLEYLLILGDAHWGSPRWDIESLRKIYKRAADGFIETKGVTDSQSLSSLFWYLLFDGVIKLRRSWRKWNIS